MTNLHGKRVLLTHADTFMGPALRDVLREQGAEVVCDADPLVETQAAARAVEAAGRIDILLVHLAFPAPTTRAGDYSAARGAQLAYAQSVGVEIAPHNVQVDAITQNFVDNPTYFPPEVKALPAFQERLKREVRLGRLVTAREDALFCAYLCSEGADCFVGQVFPACGGWAPR